MIAIYWILEYIFSFTEIYMSFVFCDAFLNKCIKKEKIYVWVSSFIIAIICISCNFYNLNSWILSILLFLLCFLINFIIRRKNLFKLIFVFFMYYGLMSVADLIFIFISKLMFGLTNFETFGDFGIQRTVTAAASKMLLTIVCLYINKMADKDELWNKQTGLVLTLSSVFVTVITYITYMMFVQEKYENSSLIMMFFFVIMLGMMIVIYCSVNSLLKTEKKRREFEVYQYQTSLHEKSIKEQDNAFELWRESIHNYKNTMIAMKTMLENKNLSELEEFVDKEVDSFKNKGIYVKTGNSVVDTIINSKMRFAEKLGITFTVNARMPDSTRISDIHLSIIIGNLLDNAIEAQNNEISKNININISIKKTFLFIEISNSFTKPYFSINTQKETMFHGIGLKSVKRIVEEYNGDFSIQREKSSVVAIVIIEY